MPRHALKCLLYYNNFFLIGLDQKYSIYIRHLIGRRLRVDSERSAKLPDKVFLCVSYYDKVVHSENHYLKKYPRIKIGQNCNTSHLTQCKRLSCRRWQLDINIKRTCRLVLVAEGYRHPTARQNIGLCRPRQSSDSSHSSGRQHTAEGIQTHSAVDTTTIRIDVIGFYFVKRTVFFCCACIDTQRSDFMQVFEQRCTTSLSWHDFDGRGAAELAHCWTGYITRLKPRPSALPFTLRLNCFLLTLCGSDSAGE